MHWVAMPCYTRISAYEGGKTRYLSINYRNIAETSQGECKNHGSTATENGHILFDRRIYVVAAFWEDDNNEFG